MVLRSRYAVVIVAIVVYVILDVIVQLLPPHYNPISQAESDLAVGPFGYIMAVNFLNQGLFVFTIFVHSQSTIRLTGEKVVKFRGGSELFGRMVGRCVTACIFPTDVPATPISWHWSYLPRSRGNCLFRAGAFSTLLLSANLGGNAVTLKIRQFALPIAVLVVIVVCSELMTPFFAPHFAAHFGGLLERIFLASMLAWIAAVSAYMLGHLTRKVNLIVLK